MTSSFSSAAPAHGVGRFRRRSELIRGRVSFRPAIAYICARRFLHAGKIVVAPCATNDEFPIIGFFHSPVFPHHHGRNSIRSLQMRNVKTFDSPRRFRQAQRLLQSFGDRRRTGLQNAEALLKGMARIFLHQFQKCVFRAALRIQNFHAVASGSRCVPRSLSVSSRSSRSSKSIGT